MGSKRRKVLIIEDVLAFCRQTQATLREAGFDAEYCQSPPRALDLIGQTSPDLVITGLVMRELHGFKVISGIRGVGNDVPILMVTTYGNEQAAVEAIRLGASDYMSIPCDPRELVARVRRNLQGGGASRAAIGEASSASTNILWRSRQMKEVLDTVGKVAVTDSRVLIHGETGTGKQLVARAIHTLGPRRSRPLVELNCAAVPENLLESELFGHEKGSFTGADRRWGGRFEEAGSGTLFLDEIGDLSYPMQSKLLHVLQDGNYTRVGGKGALQSRARVIAATNRDLQQDVDTGRFRSDLFYRLNVIGIRVPPLRDRPDDIPLLADHFLGRFASRDCPPKQFTDDAIQVLTNYRWPGNVRELENIVERCAILHPTEAVGPEALPEWMRRTDEGPSTYRPTIWSFKTAKAEFEKRWLSELLEASGGNMAEAARLARMDRAQFFRMAKRHSLNPAAAASPK